MNLLERVMSQVWLVLVQPCGNSFRGENGEGGETECCDAVGSVAND